MTNEVKITKRYLKDLERAQAKLQALEAGYKLFGEIYKGGGLDW